MWRRKREKKVSPIFFAILGGINQTKATSVGKLTNTAAEVARLQQKRKSQRECFLPFFFKGSGVKKWLFFRRSMLLHTHTHNVREAVITPAIIATATKVCHVTLSVPGLFHSTSQPFSFHCHNSRCPLYSPRPKVQHSHSLCEWYRERRSP